jgi:peptidyl-prolyl cis-trans isomerase D
MATLQKLRTNAGLLLAIVIFVALAAFILGDLLQSGSSIIRGQQLKIAEIDGESVQYPEFQARFEQITNIYKSNNNVNSLDENAYQQVLNQTWEVLVQEKIMDKVYKKLGIDVTSDELFDMVQGNNMHPIMQQLFGNPETGQVDKAQIIRFLKYVQSTKDAPQREYWMNVEKQLVSTTKQNKYTNLVSKALYANSLQARNSLDEKGKDASLKYIMKKYTELSDADFKVSESEMKAYYKNNEKIYKQTAQRTISYVTFDIAPSVEDDKETLKLISDLKSDFTRATDNVQFVNVNSDSRFEDTYNKEQDFEPTMSLWAFNAIEGEMFGPYKEGNVYKLAKLNAIKMLPDSVKASHILVRVQSAEELQTAQSVIDSLKLAISLGKITFEKAAEDNSQDGTATKGGDLGWFKRGMMVAPFEKAAFHAEKNEMVSVVTQFGVHLIKVTDQSKKSKHVQLAIIDREVTPSTTTYQNIYSEASKFAANAQDLKGLEKIAADKKIVVREAVMGENDRNITGLGATRNLVRAAFINAETGDLIAGNDKSPVFELENKFVVAGLALVQKDGIRSYESVKPSIQATLIKEKKQEKLKEEFAKAKSGSIDATASKLGLMVEEASGFSVSFGSVNKIGYEPAINGAAIALTPNKLSEPIVGRNGVYMIELTSINSAGGSTIENEKQSLYAGSQYRANYQAFRTLKDNVEIVDSRSKFY